MKIWTSENFPCYTVCLVTTQFEFVDLAQVGRSPKNLASNQSADPQLQPRRYCSVAYIPRLVSKTCGFSEMSHVSIHWQ